MKYFISILLILFGMFMTIKSEWILKFFGYNEWAENKFRIWGGSRMLYKLIGLVFVLAGVFLMTGWLEDIARAIFLPTVF